VAIPSQYVVGGTGLATPTTVQNYLAMRAEALKAGFDLKVTSAYRSDATQVQLWNANPNPSVVGKPCSLGGTGSNHNSGQALDLTDGCSPGSTCNSAAYQWLKANGGKWGFYNNLPTDPVHWSPTGH
jgi:LAS superfamily LD-carboxypeptidase LdcB